MTFVVAYDIASDKKRNKLSSLLDRYGKRVQYSLYEIEINKAKLESLLWQIQKQKLFDKETDSIRFYDIHKNSIEKSFELCKREEPFEVEEMFI